MVIQVLNCNRQALIVPLWNWNSSKTFLFANLRRGFNCTFMELKSSWRTMKVRTRTGFNCTFMELKYFRVYCRRSAWGCFNCTFMELKSNAKLLTHIASSALIVPLWNWNQKPKPPRGWVSYSFNCTFMELKSSNRTKICCATITRFNCTFMELKCSERCKCNNKSWMALIVPLWNWNWGAGDVGLVSQALIVPLWNWNSVLSLWGFRVNCGFNCTFMELKYLYNKVFL